MWIRLLCNKYVPFWKGFMRTKATFFNKSKFIVGNGNTTRFWDDTWLGDKPLALQYPSLYNIVQHKDAHQYNTWLCSFKYLVRTCAGRGMMG